MSEKDKKILESIKNTLPVMDEVQKAHMLGFAEGIASAVKKEEREGNALH